MLTKIGNHEFEVLTGKITNDSYSTTIKKLALLNPAQKTGNEGFVQVVPARLCAGYNHVFFALEHALSALDAGTAFSRKPELEFLIHFFGEKQLGRAIEKARFSDGEDLVLIVNAGKSASDAAKELGFAEKKIQIGKNADELMGFYGITKPELETAGDLQSPLERLVVEKCAFVALER